MLREEPYGRFCRAAMKGLIRALVGGPNCRTWSILRWFPKTRDPAREGEAPGPDLGPSRAVQAGSGVLLRFLVIMVLAHEGAKRHGHARPPFCNIQTIQFNAPLHPRRQNAPASGPSNGSAHWSRV